MKQLRHFVVLALVSAFAVIGSCNFATLSCANRLERRLARIDRMLDKYVSTGQLAGVVALVLRDGKPFYERATGWRDREEQKPMLNHTLFRIASFTKAVTSAAVLLLVEEKKIGLHDPVSKYIPQFAGARVMVRSAETNAWAAEPAIRPVTIHQLLTHTSGISYGTQGEIAEIYRADGLGPALGSPWNLTGLDAPICDIAERLADLPFVKQPGEGFTYGYSTDILGCVIERASKQSLDAFIRKRISGPLAMNDTHFFIPAMDRDRLATVYGTKEGKAERLGMLGSYSDGPKKCYSGGAGLLSTAADYAKFLEMIRLGGTVNGLKILKEESVKLMTTSQIGVSAAGRGFGFGYGFETTERAGINGKESVGSFGWTGAYGTFYRVDPEQRLTIILLTQMLPNGTDVKEKFWNSLYHAVAGADGFP
ncbi:serine hydrolase domain-containing protein [Turneriella parva]|uniref:Beta-lactamase n=1 Tax=Turneriella parva (strain ATCC BAA-1111 / DSM 21527 / NCTC 11395 / H) TaxID=869212 RepID=I4B4V8_TURPD|nr:serine hydrolase domain-containing protein [Turneriella parva]AFM12315.1 beta-lactamase [Turneriella parva DSM 21527]